MTTPSRSVLLAIVDGLRPDAVRADTMPWLSWLRESCWSAREARTVSPSITVAALASLGSGLCPASHGLIEPGLASLPRLRHLRPLPKELRRHGIRSYAVLGRLPAAGRMIANSLLGMAGFNRILTDGATPSAIALQAGEVAEQDGFTALYFNGCDVSGHVHGWMSPAYLDSAAEIDQALSLLEPLVGQPGQILAVVADHGGGGVHPTDHDLPHPVNSHIPLILAGCGIRQGHTDRPVSLLDLPPTVLHALGVHVPPEYEGRILNEAFLTETREAAA